MSLALLALAISLVGTCATAAAPAGHSLERKVIIVVADTATWDDYTSSAAPFMRDWLRECALGVVNARTATPTPPAAYLTLGASSRAAAALDPDLAALALNYDELYDHRPAYEIYRARTDGRMTPGALAYLGLPYVAAENAVAQYPLRLGLMGGALRQAGLATAAIGNADLYGAYRRQIVTIVMDESGMVAHGNVGPSMYAYAPQYEPPVMTNYAAVLAELKRVMPKVSVVAIETGDLSRINEQRALVTPQRFLEERQVAMARMDRFMRQVVGMMRGHPWRLYLVTPSALSETPQGRGGAASTPTLAPIAAWGDGIAPGLLTSPSTRRLGIITNLDLAPTVLDYLGVAAPAEAIGRPASVQPAPAGDVVAYVSQLQQAQERAEDARQYVLKRVTVVIAAVFIVIAALLLLAGPAPDGLMAGLREAMLVVMAFPIAALVVPASAAPGPVVVLIAVVVISAALYVAARGLSRWAPPWAWLTGAFSVLLCVDIAWRQALVQNSVLSYSVSVGARYYGLGNELGGVLISAAPLAVAGWLAATGVTRAKRMAAGILLLGVLVVMGHPRMGTKFGMAAPAALGFGLMMLRLYSPRLRWRHVLIAVGGAAAVTAVVAGVNWLLPGGERSHIGQAVEAVRRGGMGEVAMIFSRRAALNWLLVRHSTATWLMVSAVVVIACIAMGRGRALSEQMPADSPLTAGLIGAGVGSVVAFMVNDAGVLAAAWGLTPVAATMVYLTFDWRLRQGGVRMA